MLLLANTLILLMLRLSGLGCLIYDDISWRVPLIWFYFIHEFIKHNISPTFPTLLTFSFLIIRLLLSQRIAQNLLWRLFWAIAQLNSPKFRTNYNLTTSHFRLSFFYTVKEPVAKPYRYIGETFTSMQDRKSHESGKPH